MKKYDFSLFLLFDYQIVVEMRQSAVAVAGSNN
jgi:hypothetical protein